MRSGPTETKCPPGSTQREHVLVIDDEEDIRESLAEILSLEGYEVTTAESGATAIERAKLARFSLVITDLKMPGMDGIEVLVRLKQLHPGLPVIVATGYASDETASRCRREGAYDYIRKPFDLDDLLRLITQALQASRGTR
jgi:DNA-binding NtrC family response regulator